MKKFCLFTLSLLALGASAGAQNSAKISLPSQALLDTYRMDPAAMPAGLLQAPVSRSAAPLVSVLVETSSQQLLDSLAAEGYETEYISRSFSLVTMPIDQIENLAESPAVKTLSFGVQAHSTMNDARSLGYVTTCHSGLGINYNGETNVSFKGDGVLVGAFDTGFDPGHVNFYDADQTDTRIDFYAKFNGSNSTNPAVYRGEATKTAPTDNNQESHGSHVVGIAAGAYNGEGKYMTSATKDEGNVPFYGVAPQAHIAMCAGQLYNSNILAGVRRLINFAKEEGKPIVVNLSIGVNVGPHDGTESDVRALNELAEEVPICIASGNEGADYIATGKEFTEAGSMKTMFKKTLNSYVDVWSSTATPSRLPFCLSTKPPAKSSAAWRASPEQQLS